MSIVITGVQTIKDGGTKELQLSENGRHLTVFVDNRMGRSSPSEKGGVYGEYPKMGNNPIRNRGFIQGLIESLKDGDYTSDIASSIIGYYGEYWIKGMDDIDRNVDSSSNDEGVYPSIMENVVLEFSKLKTSIFETLVNQFNRLIEVELYISEVSSPLILKDVMITGTLDILASDDERKLLYAIWDNDERNYCTFDTKSIITLHYDRRGDGETQTIEFPVEFLNETKFMSLVMRKAENKPMGEFILFQCQQGFDGGVKDMMESTFNDLDKAIGYAKRLKCVDNYIQVVRHSTMKIEQVI